VTQEDRARTLQTLAALLNDNVGNRLTHALVNGICNTLHDLIPVATPQTQRMDDAKVDP
jgi:hypothetical protein